MHHSPPIEAITGCQIDLTACFWKPVPTGRTCKQHTQRPPTWILTSNLLPVKQHQILSFSNLIWFTNKIITFLESLCLPSVNMCAVLRPCGYGLYRWAFTCQHTRRTGTESWTELLFILYIKQMMWITFHFISPAHFEPLEPFFVMRMKTYSSSWSSELVLWRVLRRDAASI